MQDRVHSTCRIRQFGFAGQHRANTDFLDFGLGYGFRVTLDDEVAVLDDHLARDRVLDVFGSRAAENARSKRDDHLTGIDYGLDVDAVVCRNPLPR